MDAERIEREWRRMREALDRERRLNDALMRYALDGARGALATALDLHAGRLHFEDLPRASGVSWAMPWGHKLTGENDGPSGS